MCGLKKYFAPELMFSGQSETVYLAEDVDEELRQLKQRNLELMAQVERLKWALNEYGIDDEEVNVFLSETPQKSLPEHEASVMQGFIDFMDSEGPWTHREEAVEYTRQLRQQADKYD